MTSLKLTKRVAGLGIACAVALTACNNEETTETAPKQAEVDQAKAAQMAQPDETDTLDSTVKPNLAADDDGVQQTDTAAVAKTDTDKTEQKVEQKQTTTATKQQPKPAVKPANTTNNAEAKRKAAEQAAAKKKAEQAAAAKKKAAEQAAAKKSAPAKVVEADTNGLSAPTDDSIKMEIVQGDDTY